MTTGSLLFISGGEIFIVVLVVLVLFGSKKIPELMRGLGKGMAEFKRATTEIKRELEQSDMIREFKDSAKDITSDLNATTSELKKEANDIKNDFVG